MEEDKNMQVGYSTLVVVEALKYLMWVGRCIVAESTGVVSCEAWVGPNNWDSTPCLGP